MLIHTNTLVLKNVVQFCINIEINRMLKKKKKKKKKVVFAVTVYINSFGHTHLTFHLLLEMYFHVCHKHHVSLCTRKQNQQSRFLTGSDTNQPVQY